MSFLSAERFKPHPLHFAVEVLMEDPSYCERAMFGARACYLYGRMVVVLAFPGEEPWNGILFPTERRHQPSLIQAFPALKPHPILGKWLYLREDTAEFETTAQRIIKLILQGDERLGIVPKEKKPRNRRKGRKRKRT